jgi:hypothetical protein
MLRIPLFLALLAVAAAAAPAGAQSGSRGAADPPQYQVGDRLEAGKAGKAGPKDSGRYREVKWDELISPSWNPEAIIKSLNLNMMLDSDPRANAAMERLRKEWDNAPGNPALNGAEVKIPGFVVPLEREGNALRQFLLVPYLGAFIHVPPPPTATTLGRSRIPEAGLPACVSAANSCVLVRKLIAVQPLPIAVLGVCGPAKRSRSSACATPLRSTTATETW